MLLVLFSVSLHLLYFVFHLVNTTSYSFSDETINKTKELISYDYDFYSVYNIILENINSFLYSDENNQENNENDKASEEKKEDIENQENNQQEENKEDEKNVENQENINNEESVNQSEVSHTEESEAERIKNNYAFTLPLSRNNIIRIWR